MTLNKNNILSIIGKYIICFEKNEPKHGPEGRQPYKVVGISKGYLIVDTSCGWSHYGIRQDYDYYLIDWLMSGWVTKSLLEKESSCEQINTSELIACLK